MPVIALIALFLYLGFFLFTVNSLFKGRFEVLLFYSVVFFPVYALFLTFNYGVFESTLLVRVIQYSKEVVIFSALGLWFFGQKNILRAKWSFSFLDTLVLAFLVLAIIFFILGIGEATLSNRAIYLKNILLVGIFYLFGRQVNIVQRNWKRIFNAIFVTTVLACGLVVLEKTFGFHFHSYVGYVQYNLDVKGLEPTGTYNLNFTFEAEGGKPRYGSFFANPLELSSSLLIVTALSLVYLLSVRYKANKYKYLFILLCAFITILLAYSRASFVSFFLMMVFVAFLMRYYQILKVALVTVVLIGLYVAFFASEEILYFVLDTITFQNSSSLTHIVDWLKAVDSMLVNPMGIGLGMSGNAGGADLDIIVGGENQYLIYGVQMGFLGMLIYMGMLFFGIRDSWKAFRISEIRHEAVIPFVAAAVKFGMLLPLFTANAEAYIYVSLVSWWLIGAGQSVYQRNRVRLRSIGE